MTIAYTDSLSDWDVKHIPISQFLQQQQSQWGQLSRFENLSHGLTVCPYFDFDEYLTRQPSQSLLQERLATCHYHIHQIFQHDENFNMDRIFMAHRHGLVDGKGWKVSFRFWIAGYAILVEHMPALINMCSTPEGKKLWDTSIYSSRQKLGCVGSFKHSGDLRVLEVDDRTQAEWCLAQRLVGTEQKLACESVTKGLGVQGEVPQDWEALRAVLEEAGFGDPRFKGMREHSATFTADNKGGTCPCCQNQHDSNNWWISAQEDGTFKTKNYSSRCRVLTLGEASMIEPILTDATPVPVFQQALVKIFDIQASQQACKGVDADMRECHHVRQHLENCPSCSRHHKEDLWYIYEPLHQCWTMRNSAFNCQERLLPVITNPHLAAIAMNPTHSDIDYADLFVSEHFHSYTSDSQKVLSFNGIRWREVLDVEMHTMIQDWLRGIMKLLYRLINDDLGIRKRDREVIPQNWKAYSEMYKGTEKYLSKEANIKTLLAIIKRKLWDGDLWKKMDANPHLLGLNNGILELKTGVFRAAKKEDMVSRSVGYDWAETADPVIEAAVEEFFGQLYPVEEERKMAMLYAGYALIGNHPEKKMLILSDSIGGWNGKSTFIKALMNTLGTEYSLQGTNTFLYKTDSTSETVNSHTAGLLAHKGKRLVTFEELDPKRQLNGGLMKVVNGVCAKMQGRACHSNSIEEFEWTAKMVLAFNQSAMPDFDWTDGALISRMIMLHHRSKFCETTEQMAEEKNTSYVFLADSNLDVKLQLWRPYLLRFFLQGSLMYFQWGFTKVPEACVQWRKELVKERDTVSSFVEEHLHQTGSLADGVDAAALYEDYKQAFPEEKSKRSALGKRKWFEQLHKILGDDGYYEAQRTMPDGSKKRRSWIGWRTTM